MGSDQAFTNIANDIFSGGGLLCGFMAVVAGSLVVAQAAFQFYDVVQGRHDAPTARAVALRALAGGVLMGFASLTVAVSGSVGGGRSATTYASLSFSGSGAAANATQLNAVLVAVFEVLQVMGIFSELRGVFAYLDILDHKANSGVWRACGYIFGGGCLVHLSLIITELDAVMQTGFFS